MIITLEVAAKVNGVVITSSPSLMPNTSNERCNAAVPELTAIAYLVPIYYAKFFSNCLLYGPDPLRHSSLTALSTAFASSSSIFGSATLILKSDGNYSHQLMELYMPHSILILKLMHNKQSHVLLISVKSENNNWKKNI